MASLQSHFSVSKRSISSVIERHDLTGLSLRRAVAKSTPEIPQPTRPNVAVKFPAGPNTTGRYIRDLPKEESPKAVSFAEYRPDHDGAWTVSPEVVVLPAPSSSRVS